MSRGILKIFFLLTVRAWINQSLSDTLDKIYFPFKGVIPSGANFNDYGTDGIYSDAATNANQVNVPHSPDNGILIVLGLFNHIHQIWIGCYSGTIKTRYYNSKSWTQWRDI